MTAMACAFGVFRRETKALAIGNERDRTPVAEGDLTSAKAVEINPLSFRSVGRGRDGGKSR